MTFKIDFSNPEEIAAKMPQLQRLFEAKLREQKALNEQVELLRRLVEQAGAISRGGVQARRQSQPGPQPVRRRRASPAQDRAVQALEQATAALGGNGLGPTSLYRFMKEQGIEVPRNAGALGTNLWDAWRAGRIMRAPNGVYTPLDGSGQTEWDRPLIDYYYAAEQGFPIPGSWPPAGSAGP
jgi:hypothetical protein